MLHIDASVLKGIFLGKLVLTHKSEVKGVPEFFENEIGESLSARTECLPTFRELGPPDLCHMVKSNPRSSSVKELGTYHYVIGADSSSMATLAAYINSLTYTIEESNKLIPKQQQWKLKCGTYCCFNAFSRVDVRIEVKIPGGVEGYIIDLRGERHSITNPAIWQETFVSAVLRAILDENDEPDGGDGKPILGLRKLDPLTTPPNEKRFLNAAAEEFWKGWQLGTDPHVQVATFYSNHLTNAIYKYFADMGRLIDGAEFFKPLYEKDSDVGVLIARAYFASDQEIKGVEALYEALKRNPYCYGLLLVQIDFLLTKNRLPTALQLAKLAVTHAPSEYMTWSKLTEVYIAMGDYESALLSLNSCPMFTFSEKDAHRVVPPARTHLPLKIDAPGKDVDDKKIAPLNGTVFGDNDPKENEVHPELLRLPSLALKGTFLKAYKLLIQMVTKVGWDDLLKYRSQVFVMEEEYRVHRALMEEKSKQQQNKKPMTHKVLSESQQVTSPPSSLSNSDSEEDEVKDDLPNAPPKSPGARSFSSGSSQTDSIPDLAKDGVMQHVNLDSDSPILTHLNDNASQKSEDKEDPPVKALRGLSIDELMRKVNKSPEAKEVNGQNNVGSTIPPNPRLDKHKISFSFKAKRLCEKWFDNLFMVLYNDLRLYTAIKQEVVQLKGMPGSNPVSLLYRKTGAEWEVYGDLCLRLNHIDDAKEAYEYCNKQKFSAKSWLKLLELYSEEGDIIPCLGAVVKLATIMDRAYIETTNPSPLARGLFKLIQKHGLAKVQNALYAMNIPQKQFRIVSRFFEFAELFKVEGSVY